MYHIWKGRDIILLSRVFPALPNLRHLGITTHTIRNPFKPLLFQATFSNLTSLTLDTSTPCFPNEFFEENSFPSLKFFEFSVTLRYMSVDGDENIPHCSAAQMDNGVIWFLNRHASTLQAISLRYPGGYGTIERDISTFFGSFEQFPRIESLRIGSTWHGNIEGQKSPLEILLEMQPLNLKELDINGSVEEPQWSETPPMLQRFPAYSIPNLTIVKLGVLFEVSPAFVAWIRSILPQLRTLWLSCKPIPEDIIQDLLDLGLNDPAGIEVAPGHNSLLSLVLRMACPTNPLMYSLSRRFPSLRMLKLLLEVDANEARRYEPKTSLVLMNIVRFYHSHVINH
jgi:hypothetical protein